MARDLKRLYTVGAALAIVGSFLPWRVHDHLVTKWICGIQLYPQFDDNGGVLVVLLSTAIIVTTLCTSHFGRSSSVLNMAFGVALAVACARQISWWIFMCIWAIGITKPPALAIGFVMVLGGLSLQFRAALRHRSEIATAE